VQPAVYVPYTVLLETYTHILVRSQGTLLSAFHTVRAQVQSVDSDQQVEGKGQAVSLEEFIVADQAWQRDHLMTVLLGAFALLALTLAVVGLYSLVSYTVARRTNEFGIRMAMGAQRSHVLWIVFSSTAVSVGSGLVVGILLSLTLTRLLARSAEGTSFDPVLLLGVTLLIVLCFNLGLSPASSPRFIDRPHKSIAL
jgi:ABC-type antimicrobial peptide transport system permease subunit